MFTNLERTAFCKALWSRNGCAYVWPNKENNYSGKDLGYALFKRVYDCSGLITACLYEATNKRIDHRGDWGAGHLMENCMAIGSIEETMPGDLAFYGSGRHRDQISHVMALIWDPNYNWLCYGASGGDQTVTTPEIAKNRGARVRGYGSHLYRRDFISFGRLVS